MKETPMPENTNTAGAPSLTPEQIAEIAARSAAAVIGPMKDSIDAMKKAQSEIEKAVLDARAPHLREPDNGVAGSGNTTKSVIRYEKDDAGRVRPVWERTGTEATQFYREMRDSIMNRTPRSWPSGVQKAAMSEASSTSVGSIVPGEVEREILSLAMSQAKILPMCRIFPMTQDTLSFPQQILDLVTSSTAENIYGFTFGYVGESALISEQTNLQYRTRQFTARKGYTLNYITKEVLADAPTFLASFTSQFGESVGEHWDHQIINGTGLSGAPLGILANPTEVLPHIHREVSAHVQFKDLIEMDQAHHEIFADDAVWLMRKATQADLALYMASTATPSTFLTLGELNGAFQSQPAALGRAIVRTRHVPALGTTGDILLFSPRTVGVGMRQGFEISTSYEQRWLYNELAIKADFRWDVMTLWKEGTIQLDSATS
jgi:HK97 family phage major capsid protein